VTRRSHIAWAMCLISTMAWGADFTPDFKATPQEAQMCQALIYEGRDTSDRKNWMHMHHFCDCIRFTNRAFATLSNPAAFSFNLQEAIQGCDYVLRATTPDFSMLPEVHMQKGKVLRLQKQDAKAAAEFREAIRGNPNFVLAYVALADLEAGRGGNTKGALQIVTEGLRRVPESKSLQRRYTEFGGKLPYPDPIVAKGTSPPPQPEAPGGQAKSAGTTVAPAGTPEKPKAETPTEPPSPSKTGSIINP